jgi:hypothetical protein
MNPPVEKRGNFSKSTIKYEPQAIWDMGTDQNASVTPVKLSTDSLTSFPQNYGLVKSQILNLNSSTDTSVGADAGNPGFSKTPAGVKTQESRLGISDNYMRKQFESTFEEIMETALNLYFAERSGIQTIKVDDETAYKLREIQPDAVNENNEVRIDYDTETEKLHVEVDASTSSMKDDAAERDRLVELLDLSQKYPTLGQIIGEAGTKELVNRIVIKTGVEDPEKIMPIEKAGEEPQQPEQPTLQSEQVQQMIQEALQQEKTQEDQEHPVVKLMKSLNIKFTDLPEDSQHIILDQIGAPSNEPTTTAQELSIKKQDSNVKALQAGHGMAHADNSAMQPDEIGQQDAETPQEANGPEELTPEDMPLVTMLQERGYDSGQIAKALYLMRQGVPNEQIIAALHPELGGQNG